MSHKNKRGGILILIVTALFLLFLLLPKLWSWLKKLWNSWGDKWLGTATSGDGNQTKGKEGPRTDRTNNPGAIRSRNDIRWYGQLGNDGDLVIFDTRQNGYLALIKQIKSNLQKGYDLPAQFFAYYVYGDPFRTPPPAYQKFLNIYRKFTGTVIVPDPKGDAGAYSSLMWDEFDILALALAIAHVERGLDPEPEDVQLILNAFSSVSPP